MTEALAISSGIMEYAGEILSCPSAEPTKLEKAYGNQLMKKANVMAITILRVFLILLLCLSCADSSAIP